VIPRVNGGYGANIDLTTHWTVLTVMKGEWFFWVIACSGLHLKLLTRLFTSALFLPLLIGCASSRISNCDIELSPLKSLPHIDLALLDDVPVNNAERERKVIAQFEQMGCPDLQLQKLPFRKTHNVVCRIPGLSEEEVLIGAHHDRLGASKGVADNWTGVTILHALAASYVSDKPIHTMTFVAFADEEDDMRGSLHYVRQIKRKEINPPRLMVNIDTIGVTRPRVDQRSAPQLQCLAQSAADSLGMALSTNRLEDMTGDWAPFKQAGIAVLSFHSLDAQRLELLHTYRDNRSLVDDDYFMQAFKVISNTLSALDHGMDLVIAHPR
jgi:hypothetical protein